MKRLSLLIVLFATSTFAQDLKPDAVITTMKKVADWQLANPGKHATTDWTQGALYAGMMALGNLDAKYVDAMVKVGEKNDWKLGPRVYHADDHAVGQMYCEVYQLRHDAKMIGPMKAVFDQILANPDTRPLGGAVHARKNKAEPMRYWWCDALFMGPPAWIRLFAVTGQKKYLDFMVQEWKAASDYLYDKEEHLYFRDNSYFTKREANGKKIFWSRGNGWVMGGLVRVLQLLPKDHPDRAFFETQFREMAEALLKCQQADGLWRASLLDPASYPLKETSGSGFYCYALTYGINTGLLDRAKFEPAARKAWAALVECVAADGKLTHVQPIGADPKKFDAEATEVYGVGSFLLAGSEIYKLAR
jgi:rhamnogalacturonyl hydrolase YesR